MYEVIVLHCLASVIIVSAAAIPVSLTVPAADVPPLTDEG